MKNLLRRIRGAIGLGLVWALGWTVAAVVSVFALGYDLPFAQFVDYVGQLAVIGFVSGGFFAGALRALEGRRRFDELSLPRFTIIGALVGLGMSALFLSGSGLSSEYLNLVISALLGGGLAAGTLTIARRAEDHALLEEGREAGEVGLTEEERARLLGG